MYANPFSASFLYALRDHSHSSSLLPECLSSLNLSLGVVRDLGLGLIVFLFFILAFSWHWFWS